MKAESFALDFRALLEPPTIDPVTYQPTYNANKPLY